MLQGLVVRVMVYLVGVRRKTSSLLSLMLIHRDATRDESLNVMLGAAALRADQDGMRLNRDAVGPR